jgi:hypothetical protein
MIKAQDTFAPGHIGQKHRERQEKQRKSIEKERKKKNIFHFKFIYSFFSKHGIP